MGTDRLSLRAWLAILLVASAVLFFAGIYLDRGTTPTEAPAAVVPSSQPEVSPAEGGGEAGEAGHSEAPASAEAAGETATEHAAEARPFGIDLESPILVGGAIVISLVLAFAILRTTSPLVLMTIIGFALLFTLFDVLEVSHQLGASRSELAVIAAILAALHIATALLALRLVRQTQGLRMVNG
jgi:hypothetical protein